MTEIFPGLMKQVILILLKLKKSRGVFFFFNPYSSKMQRRKQKRNLKKIGSDLKMIRFSRLSVDFSNTTVNVRK